MTIEDGTTTSADGTTIGYFKAGSGPALVITHGSIATKEQWLPAAEFLAPNFTVYGYDRRGRGATQEVGEYSIAKEFDDIAAMLQVAGPGAHLLGHSYGALCVLGYAEQRGLDGGTLLAFEPPLAVQGPVAGEHLGGYEKLINAGDLDGALEYALINIVRVPAEAVPMIRQTPLWDSAAPLTPTWVRELREIDALGADLAHYGSITAPTRLIAGTNTTAFLYESAHRLVEVIPGATVTDIDGGDHFAHLADPAGFAEVVAKATGHTA